MAGHSKWANIKHKKAAADAKKGKVFSKLAKEITVAARSGGGDPASNISLRTLVQKARGQNMPADNIDRAIKKGTGELNDGTSLEEIMYEGYAPGGVAVVVHVLTDNKNRSASEVRLCFTRANASLSGSGSVLRTFQRKGVITIEQAAVAEEQLLEIALEAGAEDMQPDGEIFEITTDPSAFPQVLEVIQQKEIPVLESEVSLVPDTWMEVPDPEQARQLLAFVESLEDLDDVQNVYTNLDVPEAVMAALNPEG